VREYSDEERLDCSRRGLVLAGYAHVSGDEWIGRFYRARITREREGCGFRYEFTLRPLEERR
jgi:hypothetical protein